MRNNRYNKTLIIGIFFLFFGVSIFPTISGNEVKNTTTNNILNDHIRYDDFEDYYVGEPPKASRGWSTSGEDQYQFVEARVDPLDSNNMVMLIHGSSSNPGEYCYIHQKDFANPFRYAIHYRIYTPQLSMTKTVYERLFEGTTNLGTIHRRPGEIRWGHDFLYQFDPPISPSSTRWVEEEVRVTPDELRIWHDNNIDALGGYYNYPVDGIDHWGIGCYREYNQDFYIDDFWITVYNHPPDTPQRPSGTTNGRAGKVYTYTTYTNDPDEDQVYYKWEWGDGTYSGWLGPHDSGEMSTATNSWSEGSYSIRVKAKDDFDYESDWSEPLIVTMPRTKATSYSLLLWFLERFPLLERLLNFY